MKIMYNLLVITFLVFATIICFSKSQQMAKKMSIRFKRLFPNISRECMRENRVTPERVMGVYTLGTNDRDAKCYVSCMMIRFNATDVNGNYDNQVLEKLMTNPNINGGVMKTILEKCEKNDEKDRCEKAVKFTKCIYNHKNEIITKKLINQHITRKIRYYYIAYVSDKVKNRVSLELRIIFLRQVIGYGLRCHLQKDPESELKIYRTQKYQYLPNTSHSVTLTNTIVN